MRPCGPQSLLPRRIAGKKVALTLFGAHRSPRLRLAAAQGPHRTVRALAHPCHALQYAEIMHGIRSAIACHSGVMHGTAWHTAARTRRSKYRQRAQPAPFPSTAPTWAGDSSLHQAACTTSLPVHRCGALSAQHVVHTVAVHVRACTSKLTCDHAVAGFLLHVGCCELCVLCTKLCREGVLGCVATTDLKLT